MKRLTILSWLALASLATAAPYLPHQRFPVGTWSLAWQHEVGLITLSRDGKCCCRLNNMIYDGTWQVSGNKLTVSERARSNPDGRMMTWSVELARDGDGWQGRTEGYHVGYLVRLDRPERLKMPRGECR